MSAAVRKPAMRAAQKGAPKIPAPGYMRVRGLIEEGQLDAVRPATDSLTRHDLMRLIAFIGKRKKMGPEAPAAERRNAGGPHAGAAPRTTPERRPRELETERAPSLFSAKGAPSPKSRMPDTRPYWIPS